MFSKLNKILWGGGGGVCRPPPGVSPAEECSPLKNRDPCYMTLGVYFSIVRSFKSMVYKTPYFNAWNDWYQLFT